jgi:hypothetical protein
LVLFLLAAKPAWGKRLEVSSFSGRAVSGVIVTPGVILGAMVDAASGLLAAEWRAVLAESPGLSLCGSLPSRRRSKQVLRRPPEPAFSLAPGRFRCCYQN